MDLVRHFPGIPGISDFINFSGTPIIIDTVTGNLYVLISGVVTKIGTALGMNDLNDVTITSPATGATLIYDGAQWVDGPIDLADSDARIGILPTANGGSGVTAASIGTGGVALTTASTFTPGLTFGGGSTGITYGTRLGVYTQIADMVFFNAIIVLTSKGSSTGGANLTGLPVLARNTTLLRPTLPAYVNAMAATVTGAVFGVLVENTTALILQQITAGTASTLTDAHFTNTSAILIQGNYFI